MAAAIAFNIVPLPTGLLRLESLGIVWKTILRLSGALIQWCNASIS